MIVKQTKPRKCRIFFYLEIFQILVCFALLQTVKIKKRMVCVIGNSLELFSFYPFLFFVSGQIYVTQLFHGKFPQGQVVSMQVN